MILMKKKYGRSYLLLKINNFLVDPRRFIGLLISSPFSSIAVTPFMFKTVQKVAMQILNCTQFSNHLSTRINAYFRIVSPDETLKIIFQNKTKLTEKLF